MGDLYSIAYIKCSPSVGLWGLHNLEVPCRDMSYAMESSSASFFSSLESDVSTGYLEDALADVKERSKRRRLQYGCLSDHVMKCQNPDILWDMPGDFNCMREVTSINRVPETSEGETVKRKEKSLKRVVYPFTLVKPGGVAGELTLNDINNKILMPPTKPVRHPVGNFACRPCVSADGPSLSGKAVVGLTKIQTNGSGTITIIRTKS